MNTILSILISEGKGRMRMKYLFTMMIFISILNFDCQAESTETAGKPVPTKHSLDERFIIRIPGKEEIPAPLDETKPEEKVEPIEATQPKEEKKVRRCLR